MYLYRYILKNLITCHIHNYTSIMCSEVLKCQTGCTKEREIEKYSNQHPPIVLDSWLTAIS